ncbi:hypothetical protein G9A89_023575 [Geosiphon pyriformis]|nr:hypothetical protein G9A89_023575 [Geosiphon pyriformis]
METQCRGRILSQLSDGIWCQKKIAFATLTYLLIPPPKRSDYVLDQLWIRPVGFSNKKDFRQARSEKVMLFWEEMEADLQFNNPVNPKSIESLSKRSSKSDDDTYTYLQPIKKKRTSKNATTYTVEERNLSFEYHGSDESNNASERNLLCKKSEFMAYDDALERCARETFQRDGEWLVGIKKMNVRDMLTLWQNERERSHDDLAYYDIIDITPKTNSDFLNDWPDEKGEMSKFGSPLPNIQYADIKALIVKIIKASDFRKELETNFLSTRNDERKMFMWDFMYQLLNSFDRRNDLLHENLSERMYREVFLSPVIQSLFQKTVNNMNVFFGEVCLFASAEDYDLKKSDEEHRSIGRKIDIIWTTKPPKLEFAIAEISGPPNQHQHSHFFEDKIKIAKMLKIMLNRIVRLYGGISNNLNLLKLYGLQIYDHTAYVYEMTIPYRGLYIHREVLQFKLPTNQINISLLRSCVPQFLLFKEMLIQSLTNLNTYIREAGMSTPTENDRACLFVTPMSYTPNSKKKIKSKKISRIPLITDATPRNSISVLFLHLHNMIRLASHAGFWYTDKGSLLSEQLSQWLECVPSKTEDGMPIPVKGARAIIAPHAGYSYSGPAAAFAYKCIDQRPLKRVFILGPSHHFHLSGCAVSQCTQYETPLGNLNLDMDVSKELQDTGYFTEMTQNVDENEHSIEMHLPYIYKIFESKIDSIKIIPILVGALSTSQEVLYGRLLSQYLADTDNLFIISSDFCHWGHRFSYTYYSDGTDTRTQLSGKFNTPLPIPIYKSIENLDRTGMAIIEKINHQDFVSYLAKTKNTICGRHPIGVLLCAIQELNPHLSGRNASHAVNAEPKMRFIHYSQSSQVTSERDSSVSYASAYFYLP